MVLRIRIKITDYRKNAKKAVTTEKGYFIFILTTIVNT